MEESYTVILASQFIPSNLTLAAQRGARLTGM
jgi:hypothetical protein